MRFVIESNFSASGAKKRMTLYIGNVSFTKSVIESNLSASGAKLFIGTINDGFCVI
jgi:hypothetical protein